MSKEAMKLALEALERVDAIERGMVTTSRHHYQAKEDTTKAITALREALAEQPAQREPVGYVRIKNYGPAQIVDFELDLDATECMAEGKYPAYTSPPAQRTWVGLTDEEWQDFSDRYGLIIWGPFKREIEAKLKEKNSGD